MIAFQLAWPAFAYSIRTTAMREAHVRVRPDLPALLDLLDLARARLAGTLDRRPPRSEADFGRSADAVPLLCFATAAYSGYSVLAIGIGRARQTQFNWVVSGVAAIVNVAINIALIPRYGMMGAAVATFVAYVVLFLGMWLRSRRVYPVAYQWRRIVTLRPWPAASRSSAGARLAAGRDRADSSPVRPAAARLLPARRARPACAASARGA